MASVVIIGARCRRQGIGEHVARAFAAAGAEVRTEEQIQNNSEAFILALKDEMRTMLGVMDEHANPLTDPACDDVSVIPISYADPEFWKKINILVSFGKTVHHEMQTLQHVYLDALQSKADEVHKKEWNTISNRGSG